MADIGLPYCTAIIVDEDNETVEQIGHAGKVTRNVDVGHNVVIQTTALQQDVYPMKVALCRIGSSDNCINYITKLLLLVPFWTHSDAMMGA